MAATALLAACGRGGEAAGDSVAENAIPCQPAGTASFATTCTVERSIGPEGLILTLRHPDGAFHRLLVTHDGRGVVAADGAASADVSIVNDGQIQVALGQDLYRLPATIRTP